MCSALCYHPAADDSADGWVRGQDGGNRLVLYVAHSGLAVGPVQPVTHIPGNRSGVRETRVALVFVQNFQLATKPCVRIEACVQRYY